MRNNTIPTYTVGLLIVLGAIWGSAFTLIKVLVHDLSPVEMAAGRLALGAFAVAAIFQLRGVLRWPGRDLLLPIGVVALLDTLIPYTLVGWAESRIDSGSASVLISAMPLFTVIFAAATMREEQVGPARLAGVAVGFIGVLTLVGNPAGMVESGSLGQLAVVLAAASYAAGALYARSLLRHIDPASFTATKLSLGAVLAATATVSTGGGAAYFSLDGQSVAALAALGVVCTGLSFVLYFRVVATIGSVGASTVSYVIPVFGLLFGVIFLGESIHPGTVAGMALIAAGVAAVMYPQLFESLRARTVTWHRSWSSA
jgi:drug/metabolite transporter (DMT)-like permease